MTLKELVDWALFYYDRGLTVIPAVYGDKRPIIEWRKFQKERPTREQITEWFKGTQRNIAVIVGEVSGGLVVLDFETPESYHGFFGEELKKTTWVVKTGRGIHVYFICFESIENRKITNNERKLTLEVRAKNQIVILPPSLHPSGVHYKFLSDPEKVDIAIVENLERTLQDRCESLGWQGFQKYSSREGKISEKLLTPYRGKDPICIKAILKGIAFGFRDEASIRLAQYLLIRGLSIEEALQRLIKWNERNVPPIGQHIDDPRDVERYFMDKIRSAEKTGRFGCTSLSRIAGICCGRDQCEFFQFKRKRRKEKWLITISRSM